MGLLTSCRVAWEQGAHLVALWGSDDRDRDRGYTLNVVVQDARRPRHVRAHAADRRFDLPRSRGRVSRREPDAARDVRSRRHRLGSRGPAALGLAGELADRLLSAPARFRGVAEVAAGTGGIRVRPRRRRRRARDPGRAGPRGDHRAGPLPLPDRRREGAAAGGAARLRPQGHREAIRGDGRRRPATGSPAGSPATAPSRTPGPTRRRWRRSPTRRCRRARSGCARSRSSASASPITWATSAISATTADSRSASRSSRASRSRSCARTSRCSATGSRWITSCPAVSRATSRRRPRRRIRDECDDAGARDPHPARHLRRARRPAGPLPHLRHRDARARREARADRPRRSRQRAGARPALRLSGARLTTRSACAR